MMLHQILIIIGLALLPSFAYATDGDEAPKCPPGINQKGTGSLLGRGEGDTYEEAKASAVADAMAPLGLDVSATTVVEDDGKKLGVSKTIRTELTKIVKGFEVSAECTAGGIHYVVGGISKIKLVNMISLHAQDRIAWVKATLTAVNGTDTPRSKLAGYRKDLTAILADEKEDLDAWVVLGKPHELFTAVPTEDRERLTAALSPKNDNTAAIAVRAEDDVARATLSTLLERLHNDGVKAAAATDQDSAPATWQCSLHKGIPTGSAVRFTARCTLNADVGLDPIAVDSMATLDTAGDQAARLVEEKLLAH